MLDGVFLRGIKRFLEILRVHVIPASVVYKQVGIYKYTVPPCAIGMSSSSKRQNWPHGRFLIEIVPVHSPSVTSHNVCILMQ